MPGDGATIFRDPIGKLDALRIECDSIQPIVNINARCSWIPAHATRIKSGSRGRDDGFFSLYGATIASGLVRRRFTISRLSAPR